jgi:hypothetical protein
MVGASTDGKHAFPVMAAPSKQRRHMKNDTTVMLWKAEDGQWYLSTWRGDTIPTKAFATQAKAREHAKAKRWKVRRMPECDSWSYEPVKVGDPSSKQETLEVLKRLAEFAEGSRDAAPEQLDNPKFNEWLGRARAVIAALEK